MSAAIWDNNDKNHYNNLTNNNVGQITMSCNMGKYLYTVAKDKSITSILEVGTWNGLGSTRCIVEGIVARSSSAAPCIVYSLECNPDKCKSAQELYASHPTVHILNEVFLNDQPADIEDIFPELVQNTQYRYWNSVDFDNMKNKPLFLNRPDLPEMFDMVLLDGGEFTTWYEYLAIKDRCKILALDDTNVMKCRRIVEELKAQPERWKILIEDVHERNGNVVAKRIDI
jgi:hypothetical protein